MVRDALKRDLGHEGVSHLLILDEPCRELGIGQTGQNGVASDAVRSAFLGERLGHVDDRGLCILQQTAQRVPCRAPHTGAGCQTCHSRSSPDNCDVRSGASRFE